MKTLFLVVLGASLSLGFEPGPARAADWKPAQGPLMTRWAKDVRPAQPLPEYPRPQLVRQDWLNLNGLWQLAFAQDGERPPIGRDLSESILVPFPVESALSGVMKHADRLWYRRTFQVPKDWDGRRVLLHFGAVDWEATVWVNGQELDTHRGGFDAFTLDVTDALTKDGDQELIVGVFDPTNSGQQPRGKQVLKPGGIYYTPTTGTWQTVWLEPVPTARVEALRIVPDVEGDRVRITVLGAGDTADLTAQVVVSDGRNEVATAAGAVSQAIEVPIREAKLWSPDDPFLYNLAVELRRGGEVVDSVESYFGMRSIALGKDEQGITRLMLNGQPIFQVGPLDQGFWPDGLYTAPTDEALRFDIEITKKLGFNTTRKHVKVEPDRWYYWCDKLGLLVWQDMPAGDNGVRVSKSDRSTSPEAAQQFQAELKAMVEGHWNHPSLILWVVFNEGWGQFDTARLTRFTKELDPSRLVSCASGWTDVSGVGDVHDFHVYPGPGSPDPEPTRAAVLGEFGGLGLEVAGHTWSGETWGYRGTADRDDLTRKYERLLARTWDLNDQPGLSAAIYTQLTDVETEANGLLTYDREVFKVNLDQVAAVNQGRFDSVPVVREVVPTSRNKGLAWRTSTEQPSEGWTRPDFDDSSWTEAPGGFGTSGTPGAVVRTEWSSPDIWLRRAITLPDLDPARLRFIVHHDEDVSIYLNGVLAAQADGYTTDYEELPLSDEARATLKPGQPALLAVHCHQSGGGQYIDVGLGVISSQP